MTEALACEVVSIRTTVLGKRCVEKRDLRLPRSAARANQGGGTTVGDGIPM